MKKGKPGAHDGPSVVMEAEVARQIRQHARSSMKTEICGVLIGVEQGRTTVIQACIAGANAAEGGAHVTFTQDTWEHIYAIKDKQYPDDRIVGWYHSHPGFGVFLSDHDLFIQQNFFSSPQQVAWVYDPHTDEEGCFGWRHGRVEKIEDVAFRFEQPLGEVRERGEDEEGVVVHPRGGDRKEERGWADLAVTAFMYVLFFAIGAGAMLAYVQRDMKVAKVVMVELLMQRDECVRRLQQAQGFPAPPVQPPNAVAPEGGKSGARQ